jgi:hypothetical protein
MFLVFEARHDTLRGRAFHLNKRETDGKVFTEMKIISASRKENFLVIEGGHARHERC